MEKLEGATGRPPKFDDEQKEFVTNLWQNNPKIKAKDMINAVRHYLIEKQRKKTPHFLTQDIERLVETELLAPGAITKFLTRLKRTKPLSLDTRWSTASLLNETWQPTSRTVRWLIALQYYRNIYFSKPLTVREAKWFNRLWGFHEIFPEDLSFLKISPELRDVFLAHVLACLAQVYSYREKIDTIAGIKNPDFTDLDTNLARGDFETIYKYSDKWLFDAMGKIGDDATKEEVEDFDRQYLFPSLIDQIRSQEMIILGHNLGDPEMSHQSVGLYSTILTWILADNLDFKNDLLNVPHTKRIGLLVSIRRWVKDNPGIDDDDIIASKVNELGEGTGIKTKFKAGCRVTIDDLENERRLRKEGEVNG